jgi:hypothetical protein
MLAGNSLGEVYIIYIENLKPFRAEMNKIGDSLDFEIAFVDLHYFEPLNYFMVLSKNGKI